MKLEFSLFSHLTDLKAKHFLKVRRLTDEQQVEGPAPAEIGHNDCIDRHRGKELPPGCLKFLYKRKIKHHRLYEYGIYTASSKSSSCMCSHS